MMIGGGAAEAATVVVVVLYYYSTCKTLSVVLVLVSIVWLLSLFSTSK